MTQRARFCAPNVKMWHFVSTYKDQSHQVAKKFLTSISICYVQEKNPFSFFSQICLFQTFYSLFLPSKCTIFLHCNSNGVQTKIFLLFTFVKILNHSPAQDLSNKKNRSFLRLLWAQIFLRQFIKFWHKRAILCAPTVPLSRKIDAYLLKVCTELEINDWRKNKLKYN